MDAIPITAFWLLAIWGFISRKPVLIYLLFASMSFGAFAVVPTQLTGGLTLTPAPIISCIIFIRVFGNKYGFEYLINTAIRPSRLLLLTLFALTALLATIFLPRIFAGEVDIIKMRSEFAYLPTPLFPSGQNISQLVYLLISIMAVFSWSLLSRYEKFQIEYLKALCFGGWLVIVTGLLDFLNQFLPLKVLLEHFRTASYSIMADVTIAGGLRVIGLMPEPSAYGSLCIQFIVPIYFLRRQIIELFEYRWGCLFLIVGLFLFTWLSRSSTAYLALGVFGIVVIMEWAWRVSATRRRRGLAFEFWMAFGGLSFIIALLLFAPSLIDPVVTLVDTMIFQKTKTVSFEERNLWTAVSFNATLETYGLGVGLGGTRSSNSIVAVISNTGFLGAIFYYGFVIKIFLYKIKNPNLLSNELLIAARWSYIPIFVLGLVSSAIADFGLAQATLYGLATGAIIVDRGRSRKFR